jgi:hypothetical protein
MMNKGVGFSGQWIIYKRKESITVTNKPGKSKETDPKRLSKGKRKHARRVKQEARKSPGAPHT